MCYITVMLPELDSKSNTQSLMYWFGSCWLSFLYLWKTLKTLGKSKKEPYNPIMISVIIKCKFLRIFILSWYWSQCQKQYIENISIPVLQPEDLVIPDCREENIFLDWQSKKYKHISIYLLLVKATLYSYTLRKYIKFTSVHKSGPLTF